MRQLVTILAVGMLVFITRAANAQTGPVGHFHKVLISPYIQVTFIQGETESVTINNIIVDSSKLHVEVHGGTLRLYLDGAKDIPYHKRDDGSDGYQQSHDLYPNHAVIATVVYRKLDAMSLRGTETNTTAIAGRTGKVTAFGEAEFRVNVSDRIKITAFGEAKLRYMGNPAIVKGIHIGEMDLAKLD